MISEILKKTAKIKDDKELVKCFNLYLKGEKPENSIKDFWDSRKNNNTTIKRK